MCADFGLLIASIKQNTTVKMCFLVKFQFQDGGFHHWTKWDGHLVCVQQEAADPSVWLLPRSCKSSPLVLQAHNRIDQFSVQQEFQAESG